MIRRYISIWAVCLLGVVATPQATEETSKESGLPSREWIVGVWSGTSDNGMRLYRVRLDRDGTGAFASAFQDETVQLYVISKWELQDRAVTFSVKPFNKGDESVSLRGVTDGNVLLITVTGLSWERRARLNNEKVYEKRLKRVREMMKRVKPATR